MPRPENTNVDNLLITALAQDEGSVPVGWRKEFSLSSTDVRVLDIALGALQTARNEEVGLVHRTMAPHLGLPKPRADGPGYVAVGGVPDNPKAVSEHLRTVGVTLAGTIALGHSLRKVRGDHGRALRPGGLSLGGDDHQLPQLAHALLRHRPSTNSLLSPSVYAVATGYARRFPGMHGKASVGLLAAYERAYVKSGESVTLARLAHKVYGAREAAYRDVRTEYDWLLRKPVPRAEVPKLHRKIGGEVFARLGVHLSPVLDGRKKA